MGHDERRGRNGNGRVPPPASPRAQGLQLPQSMEAERSVLGAIFLAPARAFELLQDRLATDDLHHPVNAAIYSAMRALRAAGRPIDELTVPQQMRVDDTIGRLKHVHGEAYFATLMSSVVSVENIAYHARIICEKAAARRLIELSQELAARGYGDYGAIDELLGEAQRGVVDVVDRARSFAHAQWMTPAARALALGSRGTVIPTPFPTLNAACRGGPRTSMPVVLGGAPGAGKTTMAVQIGVDLARAGVHVGILAADEPADGLLIRVGQQLGLVREDLERGQIEARQALAKMVAAMPLLLIDADEERATIEDASRELAARAGGKLSCLIVDSVQKARAIGTDTAENKKARVDAAMAAVKRAATVDRHLAIATCELSRQAYQSSDPAQRVDDLAAFKESGDIEYAVTTALVLRKVKGDGDYVEVTMPKNRQGDQREFRLALDRKRASFVEVKKLDEDAATDINIEVLAKMKKRVLNVLEKSPEPLRSRNAIWARTKGMRHHCLEAIKELMNDDKVIAQDPATKRFYVIGSDSKEPVREPAQGPPKRRAPVRDGSTPPQRGGEPGEPGSRAVPGTSEPDTDPFPQFAVREPPAVREPGEDDA